MTNMLYDILTYDMYDMIHEYVIESTQLSAMNV